MLLSDRINEAKSIIKNCIGLKGVWASTDRYRNQCWTRDFCLATCPIFLYNLELKDLQLVQTHLFTITKKQRPDGKIPILYLDDKYTFLQDKIQKSINSGSISFMLQRYLNKEVENLTPHTRDSEVLFIITVAEFLKLHPTSPINNILIDSSHLALQYIQTQLKDDLIAGGDWRDTRLDLNDKTVLTNACLLYKAYITLNEIDKATHVKNIIHEKFWNGNYFKDYPESNTFDIMGNSLAILYDLADSNQRELIFTHIMELETPFGFKMTETFLPALSTTEKELMNKHHAVIWPFTNGFILNAMILKGRQKWYDIAKIQFNKWIHLSGFYEWYDIENGNGFGSKDQVWSAALFLQVVQNLSSK